MERDEQLAAVNDRLRVIEERLARLENVAPTPFEAAVEQQAATFDFAVIGKAILILGGAFLLRAPTDAELIPRVAGIALGLTYAVAWLAFAVRSVSVIYAATAAAIAYPIIGEATMRFGVFNATAAAVALALISIAYIVIASIHSLHALAWIAGCGATVTSIVLAWSTKSVVPFLMELTITGAAALILVERPVGWLLALESDVLALALIGLTFLDPSHDARSGVIASLLLFALAWIATATAAPIQAAIGSLIGLAGGSILVLQTPARAVLYAAAMLIAAEIARRTTWSIFAWQSALWGVLAVVDGGTFALGLAAALALIAFLRQRNIALLAITVYGCGALLLSLTASAIVETIVLAGGAVMLAIAGRALRVQEATQLAAIVLLAAGAKIAFVDLRTSAAVTMFATLIVYGGAVVAIARLRRVAVIS